MASPCACKVLVLSTVLIATATCLQLPDLNSVFNSFAKESSPADEYVGKERVKRQDPGIGDESNLPHLIRSASLPLKPGTQEVNERYMPVLGNGHLATTIYDDSIFLNGLYDGTGSESSRAAIPARVMSRVKISNQDVEDRATRKFILNAEEGYFMETIDCDFAYIEHKLYVHKHFIRLLVSDIYYRPKSGSRGGKIILTYPDFDGSEDITFGHQESYFAHYHVSGQTNSAEEGASAQTVHVFWMDTVSEIYIGEGDTDGNETFVMSIDRHEGNARAEFDEALNLLALPNIGHWRLYEYHMNAWRNLWARGRVEVEGDVHLAKVARFAQFYLHGSLPTIYASVPAQHSEFMYGVSRTSLGKGRGTKDYQGHVMWDNEVYILPALVLFHPDLVKVALRYRKEMGESARQIAEDMGAQGYKYPFRSGFTGREVSPSGCLECENRKYHVSAAVAWAIRQYFSATRDRDYLMNTDYSGCDVAREIARFFANRAVYDPETGRYAIKNVTGPDETYPNRHNNAYTLVSANLAINYARYLACQCQRNERDEVPDEWVEKALYFDLPFDNVQRLHGQFTGFLDVPDPRINQADVIMLTYPLNWNMSRQIMRHDLEYYEQITSDLSPAMTWSFFTIGWKWVEDIPKRDNFFLMSYQNYLIQPFKVWTEFTEMSAQDQEIGNVNFLPGMGGFIQSLVYGFGGVRIRPEMLEFHNPIPPPGCSMLRLAGLHYLSANLTVEIEENVVTVTMVEEGDYPLVLKKNDTTEGEEILNPGGTIVIDNPRAGFFIYTNQMSGCEHPRDYIYMPWGYSPFVDSAPILLAPPMRRVIGSVLFSLTSVLWIIREHILT